MSVQQEQLADENNILLLRLDSDHTLDFTRTATLHASVIAISVSSMAIMSGISPVQRVRTQPRSHDPKLSGPMWKSLSVSCN
jgi:hypothetical protein